MNRRRLAVDSISVKLRREGARRLEEKTAAVVGRDPSKEPGEQAIISRRAEVQRNLRLDHCRSVDSGSAVIGVANRLVDGR
jgi:hypothetical protein